MKRIRRGFYDKNMFFLNKTKNDKISKSGQENSLILIECTFNIFNKLAILNKAIFCGKHEFVALWEHSQNAHHHFDML